MSASNIRLATEKVPRMYRSHVVRGKWILLLRAHVNFEEIDRQLLESGRQAALH